MRATVRRHLGYDPVNEDALVLTELTASVAGDSFVVRIERSDGDGRSLGAQTLRSRGESCAALIDASALSLSIALDPTAAARASAPPPPADVVTTPEASLSIAVAPIDALALSSLPSPPNADVPTARPEPSTPSTFGWRASATMHASWGSAPNTAAGFTAQFAGEGRRWSLGLEARYDAPASDTLPGSAGVISSWLAAGTVVPCLKWGPVSTCGLASIGQFLASSSEIVHPETKSAFYAAVGARATVEAPVASWLSLLLQADVSIDVARTALDLGATQVWDAPLAITTVGAGAATHFH